ncbi:hypothetical protein KP509_07G024400 [Ceratopteris richardii]|nr:hypothetical protein KP509_07G024400 [Ceratopteris richardii]
MYGHCGYSEEAFRLFEQMPERNVVTWNAMIVLSARCRDSDLALHLFQQMLLEGFIASAATYTCIIQAACNAMLLSEGAHLHAIVIAACLDSELIISNALMTMYCKFRRADEAHTLFHKMLEHNVVSWTVLITCYLQQGNWFSTFQAFQDMQLSGITPNSFTFVSLLSVCAAEKASNQGQWVHQCVCFHYSKPDTILSNALLHMYSQCGNLEDAWGVFKAIDDHDAISWTTIIAAHSQQNFDEKALQLFKIMQETRNISDNVGYITVLNTISTPEAVAEGKRIHVSILNTKFAGDPSVGMAILNMYGRCNLVEDAWHAFERLPCQNFGLWNTMLKVFVEQGEARRAFQIFCQMKEEGFLPNHVSFAHTLSLCTDQLSSLEGKRIHVQIFSGGYDMSLALRTALLFMYGKDGDLEAALAQFHPSFECDTAFWNAMLGILSCHGREEDAIHLFHKMQQSNAAPDRITFMNLILVCGHCGLIDLGCNLFYTMHAIWGIRPDLEHLNCMVDLLARAGCLEEAEELIERMGSMSNATTWTVLTAGYKQHGFIQDSVEAARKAIELEPMDSGTYILLSNVCS